MAPNFPSFFVEMLKYEIPDATMYSDNELYTFVKIAIITVTNDLAADGTIPIVDDLTHVYDYTITGEQVPALWDLYKKCAVALIVHNRYTTMVAEGSGISITLGAEHIDTKSVLIGSKEASSRAFARYKSALLNYSMSRASGYVVDLYRHESTW